MKFLFYFFCLLLFAMLAACREKLPLFTSVSSGHTGIHFNNHIVENDSINPFDLPNMYNGGGVGIGDFNNDGLQDIYFTGNQVSCKMYINKGDFIFTDITDIARVDGNGRWCRGVAVVDINNDGWQDIYVCTTILADSGRRQNLLYVNQGVNAQGIPVFREMAKEYGLNDNSCSTMASFFDYDNDGDLDVYITVNDIDQEINPSVYRPKVTDGSSPSTGRLYRNDWNPALGHAVFTNVTKQAGVTIEGYGHSATIADFNRDGWKDIFVANDFLSNDLLYINNRDGTFTDKSASYFKHTSANGMGQDVIDINNDGLADVVEMDMDPEDNYRKKLLLSGYNYQNYQNNDSFGYQYQYVRNTLQLNQGPRLNKKDSIGDPLFADIGYQSGISSTDWSWAPLVQDFDNDGFRDIVVTNGFPKDLTDHDFIAFREKSFAFASKKEVLTKIPQDKIQNYAFKNEGGAKFDDVSGNWGLTALSFSNGAAYADLDNDGDMDVVINNINDEAFVYRNNSFADDSSHYLSVKLTGDSLNRNGLGTWLELYYNGRQQVLELTPYRGYLSSIQINPHFGLGKNTIADSLVVKWPDRKMQVLTHIPADQELSIDHKNANDRYSWSHPVQAENTWFKDITDSSKLHYQHQQEDFIDFNIQKLLPHKLSEYGPAIAVGDVNNDGLDDICVGGSTAQPAAVFIQEKDGTFTRSTIPIAPRNEGAQDMGLALFDADNDGDIDLLAVGGGYQPEPNTFEYEDRLFANDGRGHFTLDSLALPKNFTSKSCVRAFDYDHDGDLDLFIAGRIYPWNYPKPVSSFVYRNDTKNGKIKFTDVTATVAPSLINLGMICDGICTDFDNDGWQDLILAGEWMPITFLRNDHGKFQKITTAISSQIGLWNSISSGDFDNDGDMDYLAGNLGENSFYRASDQYPISIYAKDFYNQGTTQCVLTTFLKDKQGGVRKQFTTDTRDDVVEQLPFLKKRFLTYKDFASASFDKLFTAEELKNSIQYTANNLKSSFIRNNGDGTFTMESLPDAAQYSAINGMVVEDFNGDGNLDVCMNTNDYGTQPSIGRYDALNGLVLQGDGRGHFTPLTMLKSGVFIPGNGKAMAALRGNDDKYLVAASQNKGVLKLLELAHPGKIVSISQFENSATIIYSDGRKQRREFGSGSSFLSQSGRFLWAPPGVSTVLIKSESGKTRMVDLR